MLDTCVPLLRSTEHKMAFCSAERLFWGLPSICILPDTENNVKHKAQTCIPEELLQTKR